MDQVEKEVKKVLDKFKVNLNYKLEFPMYKVLPDEVKLALKILERHGMKIVITFVEKTK